MIRKERKRLLNLKSITQCRILSTRFVWTFGNYFGLNRKKNFDRENLFVSADYHEWIYRTSGIFEWNDDKQDHRHRDLRFSTDDQIYEEKTFNEGGWSANRYFSPSKCNRRSTRLSTSFKYQLFLRNKFQRRFLAHKRRQSIIQLMRSSNILK